MQSSCSTKNVGNISLSVLRGFGQEKKIFLMGLYTAGEGQQGIDATNYRLTVSETEVNIHSASHNTDFFDLHGFSNSKLFIKDFFLSKITEDTLIKEKGYVVLQEEDYHWGEQLKTVSYQYFFEFP